MKMLSILFLSVRFILKNKPGKLIRYQIKLIILPAAAANFSLELMVV
jgi:hypothetical protein